jgi:synaptotagmin-like protein
LLVTSETAGIPRSPSASSIHSAYSDNETGRGDYDITGEIQIGIVYKGGKLLVHVNRARGLAAADSNGFSDPYVKTYLLPDRSKHSKRKTNVQRKTLSPIFDETLEYSVSESELSSRTLWLSVWDWDRFGRNQFLGEIKVSLKSLNLRNDTELWYTLVDKAT